MASALANLYSWCRSAASNAMQVSRGGYDAFLRVCDHLIGLFLAEFAYQPLREFELHDGGHDPLRLARELLAQCLAQRAADEPFDPGRSIDHTQRCCHQ